VLGEGSAGLENGRGALGNGQGRRGMGLHICGRSLDISSRVPAMSKLIFPISFRFKSHFLASFFACPCNLENPYGYNARVSAKADLQN
jgi:hypothetical protein